MPPPGAGPAGRARPRPPRLAGPPPTGPGRLQVGQLALTPGQLRFGLQGPLHLAHLRLGLSLVQLGPADQVATLGVLVLFGGEGAGNLESCPASGLLRRSAFGLAQSDLFGQLGKLLAQNAP
jgi:hypothetical protein